MDNDRLAKARENMLKHFRDLDGKDRAKSFISYGDLVFTMNDIQKEIENNTELGERLVRLWAENEDANRDEQRRLD